MASSQLSGSYSRLPAGEASALAMASAYIWPAMTRKQKAALAFASSFAPKTWVGLWIRDLVIRSARFPPIAKLLMQSFVNDQFALPLY